MTVHESPYDQLDVGSISNLCTTNRYGDQGSRNKLSNHKYLRFVLSTSGNYRLKVSRNNGTGSDPDFHLFKSDTTFRSIGVAESPLVDVEEITTALASGAYLLDISDWNTQADACFDVSVEEIE